MDQPSVDLVALNPQPLPPDAKIKLVALNPQPLPPDATIELVALNPQPLPPQATINLVALNPQPLPPRARIRLVALNPQPLPPKTTVDFVALNPQPLPPSDRSTSSRSRRGLPTDRTWYGPSEPPARLGSGEALEAGYEVAHSDRLIAQRGVNVGVTVEGAASMPLRRPCREGGRGGVSQERGGRGTLAREAGETAPAVGRGPSCPRPPRAPRRPPAQQIPRRPPPRSARRIAPSPGDAGVKTKSMWASPSLMFCQLWGVSRGTNANEPGACP